MSNTTTIRIFTFLLLLILNTGAAAQPRAEKGVLDLRNYDFATKGPLQVAGEWKFFWGQIIDPIKYADEEAVIIPVPTGWEQLKDIVPDIQSKGYASYHLTILVPRAYSSLAVRFTEVFSASGYYINGKNIGFKGFPGTNKFQSVFGYTPSVFVFPVNDTVLDMIVHVSNFDHRSGGIRGSFEIGTPMQIMSDRAERQFRDFFLIGAFLIIGIYFMGLYLIRSELYKLFFSLICLVMVFRIFILSDTDLLPEDWITGIGKLRLEYLSLDLLVPLFVLMIRYVFPNDFPSLLFKVIMWLCAAMIVFVIFTPVSLFTGIFPYYMYFVFFASAVILYVISIAWVRGRSHAPAFAIGIAIVVVGAVNDLLFTADMINTGLISHYTMFIYLVIYAMIFSSKTNDDFLRSQRLTDEIASINENLENAVQKRTEELNEKSRELSRNKTELEKSNEILKREVAIRDKFFTIMGHDIKGPVGYSGQILELILSGSLNKQDEHEMLVMLANSSRATLNLVENLLTWGRSQTGELKSMAVRFQLAKIVYEEKNLFDLPVINKKLDLALDIPLDLLVFADKDHVRLIVRNLLSNAIKFTGMGGRIEITAEADTKGTYASISFKDTGTGMPSGKVKHLFTELEINSTPGTNNEQGSGIGLRLCKELTEINKGKIAVVSKIGEGTVFTVKLPLNA